MNHANKKIALFSDGTGNSSAKLHRTNVWRLYSALDLSDPSKQVAIYDNGVGTSNFKPAALAGGAFGWGLARNVKELYAWLCREYNRKVCLVKADFAITRMPLKK